MDYDRSTPSNRANLYGWDCACGKGQHREIWGAEYVAAGDKCVRELEAEATREFYDPNKNVDYKAIIGPKG